MLLGAKYLVSSGIGKGIPLGLLACATIIHCIGQSSFVPDSCFLCSDWMAILFCLATSSTVRNRRKTEFVKTNSSFKFLINP